MERLCAEKGEIICKTAGKSFRGQLDRPGCGMVSFESGP